VTSAPRPSARPDAGRLSGDLAGAILLQRAGAALERRLDAGSTAPLCVGLSGGSDSLALLLLARAWASACGRRLLVLTVDHGLNPQSRAWTARAGRIAAGMGAGFRALEWRGAKPATGLPAAARRARHALLAEAAREAGAGVVLLGHTADDLAEAQRMRQDGSSVGDPREWAPSPVWPEGRGVFLLRPLLALRRAALREVLAAHGFDWLEDPANEDLRYARSLARASLFSAHPGESRDPGFFGAAVSSSDDSLDGPVAAWGPGKNLGPGFRRDERELMDPAPIGLIKGPRPLFADPRTLAAACLSAGGGERPPRRERVERLAARLASGEAFTATLAGARIEAGEEARIMRDAGRLQAADLALEAGVEAVWDGRFLVRSDRDCEVRPLKGLTAQLAKGERAALKAFPVAARAALPAFVQGETVTCPILAEQAWAGARSLVGARLAGACGRFARENDLAGGSDGGWSSGALS
jgi:tRNA(Ile)-lysidine synthase